MSDSEMDFDYVQLKSGKKSSRRSHSDEKIVRSTSPSPVKTPKKRKSQSSTPYTSKLSCDNIFGLNHKAAHQGEPNESRGITSSFVLRIANGNERRVAELQGEYVVDLKVYRTSDVKELDSLEAWKKALVRIKLQTSENTDQWRSLQRLINHADEAFEEEPRFYKDKK